MDAIRCWLSGGGGGQRSKVAFCEGGVAEVEFDQSSQMGDAFEVDAEAEEAGFGGVDVGDLDGHGDAAVVGVEGQVEEGEHAGFHGGVIGQLEEGALEGEVEHLDGDAVIDGDQVGGAGEGDTREMTAFAV